MASYLNHFPQKLQQVVHELKLFPGIGEKSALRMALSLTGRSSESVDKFLVAVQNLKSLKNCEKCGFFSEEKLCRICNDMVRVERGNLCVVENALDFLAIESSGEFSGTYHILGGVLNPLAGVGIEDLRFESLKNRLKKENVKEVMLALGTSVEGDATCSYIKQILRDHVIVKRIGVGVPVGGGLEYLDPITIGKALENGQYL